MMNKKKCLSAIIDLLDEYMSDKPKPFTFLSYEEIYHGVCSSKRVKEAQTHRNKAFSGFAFGRINPIDKNKESIQEENDELKAEIRRLKSLAKSNKFFVDKRQEDLMRYQDKQNEEIERLKVEIARGREFWNWKNIAKQAQEENEKLRRLTSTYKRSNTAKDKLIEHLKGDIESLRLASFEFGSNKK